MEPQPETDPRTLSIGGARDSRTCLRVIEHRFVIGKEDYYPFVAEMHYYRIPKRYWSVCFERIRKADFRIISTSVPWNLHESSQGDFDFSGVSDPAKDLIVFLELCREFGFKIVLRPGPWIASEWNRGGIPDYAVRHPETVAHDVEGQPLMADPGAGAAPTPVPSYLSSRFQILLKNYYSVFAEVVKNYIYPRGPVFMIELDYETSFGGHFEPFSGDFNPDGTLRAFPLFLEEKYGTIDRLRKTYRIRARSFADVEAPKACNGKTVNEIHKVLDWVEFREWAVNRYAETITELLSQTEISALFTRSLAFKGSYSFPDVAGARTGGRVLFTVTAGWDVPFSETVQRVRSVAGWQPTGFCSELSVGQRHANPEVGHAFRPVTACDTKRLIVAGLAGGLKGFNFHMFVGREKWYDAALEPNGAILPSYEVIRDAIANLVRVRYDVMRDYAVTALIRYRPYLRIANLGGPPPYRYLSDLVGSNFDDLAVDLGALDHDYRIFDLTVGSRLNEYKTLIVPVGEFMDADSQRRLLELIRAGAHAVFYGLLPKTDEHFEACDILSKGIGLRTTPKETVVTVEAQKKTFGARALGSISRLPSQATKLAKVGTRVVGASTKCGKGHVTVLTFAPGSRLLPARLSFLEHVLSLGKLWSPVSASDARVHAVVHSHAKGALLMVYDTVDAGAGSEASRATDDTRPVIITLDWQALGLPGKSVMLTDLLGEETLRATVRELEAGIELRLAAGDSRLFYIEKKS